MRRSWVLALAAGATLAIGAPSSADAQDRSIRERWEQAARRSERENDRDNDRANARERERDRERARAQERERERIRARDRERERDRIRDRERERERDRIRALERERERIRARERELERERDRLRARERELERARARELERIRRDRDRDDDDDDDDRYRRTSNRNGPSFCRSGEGHPVYGRQWCRQRGYEVGRGRGWERDRWGDIVFRDSHRRRNERLSRNVLASLLGNELLTRFESYGSQYGPGPVTGYWVPENGNVLQLSVGSTPIARLIDLNRDGRVDNLLLRR